MKTIPELIAEHNKRSQELEARFEEIRDAVCAQLAKNFEAQRHMLALELRLYEQLNNFNSDLSKLLKQ